MKKSPLHWITILIIATLLIPLGLSTVPSHAQQATTLPIGYLGSVDDDLARGLQLAIDEINASGGIDGTDGTTYTFSLAVAEVDPADPTSVTTALSSLPRVLAIFGPSDEAFIEANISTLSAASAPVFVPSRLATLNQQDTNSNLFRLIAPEATYAQALANYLVFEIGVNDIVLLQTPAETVGDGFNNFNAALTSFSTPPSQTFQVSDEVQLANTVISIANLNPEVVAAFGSIDGVASTLQLLREGGWDGLFVYPDANSVFDASEDDGVAFEDGLFAGVVGASSWSFSTPTTVGRTFVANYVANFGDVPGPLSVSGYDTMYALSILVRNGNISQDALKAGLAQLRLPNLVSGPISPALYGNRILSQTVYVFALTGTGGAETMAIYDNGVQRAGIGDDSGVVGGPAPAATATATLRPTATTLPASATPGFLVATVNNNVGALNVRTGPDTVYPEIDELRPGEQVTIIGRNQDYTWLFVQINGQTGWIFTQYVTVFDPGGLYAVLPIVPSPATPTPTVTQGPVDPDLIITNVTISPTNPQPNSPMTATITVQNQGSTNAGPFAVATSFRPGEVFTAQNVNGLAAGQTITVTLTNTVTQTGYVPDLGIVVDLNNEVAEGTAGEANNIFTIAYKVDRSIATEGSTTLNASQSINFFGANVDLSWDGNVFNMPGNARIGQLAGTDYQSAHYDQVAAVATGTSVINPQTGQVFAILTDEGNRGVLRVDNRNGSSVTITYRIYN